LITPPDRLQSLLNAGDLKPAYLVFGDEPLQIMESLDAIRQALKAAGAAERIVMEVERGFDWDELSATLSGMSLFAEQRIIEVKLGDRKPDKKGSEKISEFLASPVGEDVLLISAAKLDRNVQKAKWFKAIEKHGAIIQAKQLAGRALESWIVSRAQTKNIQIERDVADLIATRAEGNMLAAAQALEKLSLGSGGDKIDSSAAMKAIADSARYDVFKLIDTIMSGQSLQSIRMLRGLRAEGTEPIIINWALNKELRTLFAMSAEIAKGIPSSKVVADAGIWRSRINGIENTLRRKTRDSLRALFLQSIRIDRMIKGSLAGDPWDEMELLCVELTRR
jgi:DNA polymerase-3 subunit delta